MNENEVKEIKQSAYKCVKDASQWIISLAENDKYTDGYIEAVTDGNMADKGVMPVAEMIMCLFNLMEDKYKSIGVPQPDSKMINRQVKNLLSRYNQFKFSGYPYFRATDPQSDCSFTDAVCFTSGAINLIINSGGIIEDEQKEKCGKLFITCLNWMLDASINTSKISGDKKSRGWGWTSPKEISEHPQKKGLFSDYIPPQTYFTSSVLISLLEMLFDNYKEIENVHKIEETFDAIIEAKNYLLHTILGDEDYGRPGWSNFLESKHFSKLEPYDAGADEFISVYPLESLSYIMYYSKKETYSNEVAKLKELNPQKWAEFTDFPKDKKNIMDTVFKNSIDIAEDRKAEKNQAKIQIPDSFNKIIDDSETYYLDGTVIYNSLNALNFYSKYFGVANEKTRDYWKDKQINLVKVIINNAYMEGGFLHCGDGKQKNKSVKCIYATRTAIACLLSWGVAAPESVSSEIPSEIKELIRKLYYKVEPNGLTASIAKNEAPNKLNRQVIQDLMKFGFLVGLILEYTNKYGHKSENIEKLVDLKSIGNLGEANGQLLFDQLAIVLTSNRENTNEEIGRILNQKGVLKPIVEALEKSKKGDATTGSLSRELLESVLDKLGKLQMTSILDKYSQK